MQVKIDKRLEIIEAIVVAYKLIYDTNNEELDFTEYPNVPYVKKLVDKINIKKYPEINKFINDDDFECGKYTELHLYFDENMNYDDSCKNVFSIGSNKEFADIVKKIYDNENLEEVFTRYKDYFNDIVNYFKEYPNISLDEMKKFYNASEDINYHKTVSVLINGGFSSSKDNNVTYVKGIKANNPYLNYPYYVMCMFHEYSHYFVNSLVDKYKDRFENIDILKKESLENGLPSLYQESSLLYEYFVRTNTLVLSEPFVDKEEIDLDLEWYSEIGFHRTADLFEIIKENRNKYSNYEKIFINVLISYMNKVSKNLKRKNLNNKNI